MEPNELSNLALSAASVARDGGFSHTAQALVDLALQLDLERAESREDRRNRNTIVVTNPGALTQY